MGRELLLWVRKLAINAALFGALYAWKVLDIAGAGNVVRFYVWSVAIASLFVLLPDPGDADKNIESGARAVVGDFLRLMTCFALAWFGETTMAVAYLVALAAGAGYRRRCLALRSASGNAAGGEGS